MTYEQRKHIYEKALTKWGIRHQTMVAIEEMSELTKELCKNFRGRKNKDAIAEEIADVIIMLEQLRLMYGVNDDVNKHMDAKILRLKSRIE
jgi:NTP pyrophosphatase (non-canonical NTP hydrolase)